MEVQKMEIYVNWESHEIFNEQKYNEIITNKVNSLRKDPKNFIDYLNSLWYIDEVFNFTDEEKENVLNNYAKFLRGMATRALNVEKVTL